MSILACLIGILTLMISVSMQLKEIDQGRTEDEMARALENRDLQKKLKLAKNEITALEKQIEEEKSTVSAMAKLEERAIVLRKELAENQEELPEKTDAELQKLVEVMKQEIEMLRTGRPPLNQALEKLRKELAARQDIPEVAQSVVIQPGGTGIGGATNLFFVECNSTGIVIRPEKGEPIIVSQDTITSSEAYNNFLQRVKSSRDAMILFLVRRAGNPAYQWAAGWAESQFKVRTGKLPIPNDGKIDLSLFQK